MPEALTNCAYRSALGPTDEMMLWNMYQTQSVRTIQAVLETSRPITAEELDQLAAQLERSHLSRTVRHRRPRWWLIPSWTAPTPGRGEHRALTAPHCWRSWLDQQVYTPLAAGRNWRLAAIPHNNATLISLVVPHLYTDGNGLVTALSDTPDALVRPGGRVATTANRLDTAPRIADRPEQAPFVQFDTAYLTIDLASWRSTAQQAGLTPNDVLVYACAQAFLRQQARREVRVGIPVSTRDPHAPTGEANELTVIPITVAATSTPTDMAAALRARISDPYQLSPITIPPWIYRVLPTPLRQRAKKPGTKSCELLVSNFGPVLGPPQTTSVGGGPIANAFFRTVNTPGTHRSRQRTRVSVVAAGSNNTLALTISADPDAIDTARMAAAIATTLTAGFLSPDSSQNNGTPAEAVSGE